MVVVQQVQAPPERGLVLDRQQQLLDSVEKRCLLIIARVEGYRGYDRTRQTSLKNEEARLGQLKQLLRGRFRKYERWKQANQEDSMDFNRWLIITAINADNRSLNGRFLLNHPELTFDIMYSNKPGDEIPKYETLIRLKDWKNFAPFIYPLCTKQNVSQVYDKLVESTEVEANSLLPKRRKSSESAKGFVKKVLLKYIDNLRRLLNSSVETHNRERAVLVKENVTDITGLPARSGKLILTKNHLVFDRTGLSGTKSRVYDLRKLTVQKFKSPGIFKRDCSLKLLEWKQTNWFTETTLSFSGVQVSNKGTNVRDQVWNACVALIEIHRWLLTVDEASKQTKQLIENRCLRDVCDNIIREEALLSLAGITAVCLQVDKENVKDFIVQVTHEMSLDEHKFTPNNHDWAASMRDLFNGNNLIVDPERQTTTQTYTKCYMEEYPEEKELKLEMMAKTFKILKLQLAPLFILLDASILILMWEDVGVSLVTFVMLIMVWWKDFVGYIPAMSFLLNAILLIAMKNGSNAMNAYYCNIKHWVDTRRETVLNQESPVQSAELLHARDENEGFFSSIRDKFHKYKQKLRIGKETVRGVQQRFLGISNFFGRLSSIYAWKVPEKSETVCILSVIICVCLLYIPIRHLYLVIVLWAFRWGANRREQLRHLRRKKSAHQKWWGELPLTLPENEERSPAGSL